MTIGRTTRPHEEAVPEGKRLRMKDWLKSRIGQPRYPGLVWLDERKTMFRIPWKHAALHGWDRNSDGALFHDWATHTGACARNAQPKQLKATFRCALHSLPDVHEDRSQAKKRGDDACRVYKFDSISPATPRRRHIKKRNHKERDRKGSQETTLQFQNEISCLPTYTEYPVWNGSYPTAANCNNSSSNMMPYQSPERSPSFNMATHDRYFNPQRQWTQSNPDIPHGSSPPPATTTNNIDTSFQYTESFKTRQHSISVPEIRQSLFTDTQNAYENSTLQQLFNAEECETNTFNLSRGAWSPMSPDGSSYSPMHSSISASPSLQSPDSFACMSTTPMHSNVMDTIAGAVGSASAVIDGYQTCDFSNAHSYGASPYFGEKLLDSLDAVIASGAVRASHNRSSDMTFIPATTSSPHSNQAMPVTSVTNMASMSMKDYQQPTAIGISLQPKVNELRQPTFTMDNPSGGQMLSSISTRGLSPHCAEYIENRSPVGQYTTECSPGNNATCDWMSSSQNEPLPSASTLLSPSNSPTDDKNPLRWVSTNDDSTPQNSGSCYNLMEYETFTGQSENTCVLGDYSDNGPNIANHHTPSSMYGGYSS